VTTPLDEPSVWDSETALPAVRDHVACLRRVVLVGERAGWDVDKTRVGDVQLAVGDGPGHRFDEQARSFRARPTVDAQVVALEKVEHLQEGQTTRGRPRGHHLQAAVGASDGLGHIDGVALQVLFGDEAGVGFEIGGDRICDVALVEEIGAFAGEPLQRAGQVGLDHQLADRVELAVVRVNSLRRRRDLDPLGVRHDVRAIVHGPVAVDEAGDWESVASEGDRRLDRLLPRDRAESRQRLMQAGHRARYGDRLIANVVDPSLEHVAIAVGCLANEDRLPLVFARPGAGGAVELEQSVAPLRAVDEHRATPADAAHLGIDDALHERARDGRVDGVAAAPHDLEADLRRLGLRADDEGHGRKLVQTSGPLPKPSATGECRLPPLSLTLSPQGERELGG